MRRLPRFSPADGVAVVTGASTGIGAALARLLAERGYDLVLIAEPDEALAAYAVGLADECGVEAEACEVDLTDAAGRRRLADELSGRAVAVLCDNAGVGAFGDLADLDRPRQLALNVVAVTELAAAVLPGMLARGRGGILFTGSTAGNQPVPGAAIYAATKAFVNSLGEALHVELRGHGISCTVLAPGPVRSGFARRAGVSGAAAKIPGPAWVSAERAARVGLAGLEHGRRRVVPGLAGQVFDLGGRLAPRAVLLPVLHRLIGRQTSDS